MAWFRRGLAALWRGFRGWPLGFTAGVLANLAVQFTWETWAWRGQHITGWPPEAVFAGHLSYAMLGMSGFFGLVIGSLYQRHFDEEADNAEIEAYLKERKGQPKAPGGR